MTSTQNTQDQFTEAYWIGFAACMTFILEEKFGLLGFFSRRQAISHYCDIFNKKDIPGLFFYNEDIDVISFKLTKPTICSIIL